VFLRAPATVLRCGVTMSHFTFTGSQLLACCASQRFVEALLARLDKLRNWDDLVRVAKEVWWHEVRLPRFARKPRHWRDPC